MRCTYCCAPNRSGFLTPIVRKEPVKIGFACAITTRLIWRALLMLRIHWYKDSGMSAKAVNWFCLFAVAALTVKAWQCVASTDSNRAGLQGINQILGIVCLCWVIPAVFWLVGKPHDKM